MNKVTNKLEVWHYPQVPCEPFRVSVVDEAMADIVVNMLADQHLFLYEKNMIGDYNNIISVMMYDEDTDTWEEYYNVEDDMDFDEFVEAFL